MRPLERGFARVRGVVVLALAALVAVLFQQQASASTEILVVLEPLEQNTTLTPELVARAVGTRRVHDSVLRGAEDATALAGFLPADRRQALVGTITLLPLEKDQPLLRSLLLEPSADNRRAFGLSARLRSPDHTLYPLKAEAPNIAGAGTVRPGELVDVYAYFSHEPGPAPTPGAGGPAPPRREERAARLVEKAPVAAYSARDRVLTLEVDRAQAALLTFLAQGGGKLVVAPVRVDAPTDADRGTVDALALRRHFGLLEPAR